MCFLSRCRAVIARGGQTVDVITGPGHQRRPRPRPPCRPGRAGQPQVPAGRSAGLRDLRAADGISLVQRQARLPVPPRPHQRRPARPARPKNAHIREDRILPHLAALHFPADRHTARSGAPAAPPPRSRRPAPGAVKLVGAPARPSRMVVGAPSSPGVGWAGRRRCRTRDGRGAWLRRPQVPARAGSRCASGAAPVAAAPARAWGPCGWAPCLHGRLGRRTGQGRRIVAEEDRMPAWSNAGLAEHGIDVQSRCGVQQRLCGIPSTLLLHA